MAGRGVHAEARRIDLLAVDEASRGDALEGGLIDDEQLWAQLRAQTFVDEQARDYQCAVIDQAMGRDSNLYETVDGLGPAFDLNADVFTVGASMNHGVETPIQHRQKNVERSPGLPDQLRPDEKLHHLADRPDVHTGNRFERATVLGLLQI